MGALLVDREIIDVTLESIFDEVLLLVHGHVIKDRLNGVCPLFMATDLNEIVLD